MDLYGEQSTLQKIRSFLHGVLYQDAKIRDPIPPPIPMWFINLLIFVVILSMYYSTNVYIDNEALVPEYIYVSAALGTTAYLFTTIASGEEILQRRVFSPIQGIARFLAGPLVGAGIHLLSQFLLKESLQERFPAAGIAFLAGFSMEIFVQAFNSLASSLLGIKNETSSESNASDEQNR